MSKPGTLHFERSSLLPKMSIQRIEQKLQLTFSESQVYLVIPLPFTRQHIAFLDSFKSV